MASSNAVPRTLAAILGTLFGIYAIWWAVNFRGWTRPAMVLPGVAPVSWTGKRLRS